MVQGYLSRESGRTVRVRSAGEVAWLTIKGKAEGISRAEFEYEIPVSDARNLLEMCLPGIIDKTRYRVSHAGFVWEIDEFHGENAGLIVAEVEMENEDCDPELPPWVGDEVSHDRRYFNSSLTERPFNTW